MMERWNTGMVQGWEKRNDLYFLSIIPTFQHSTKIVTDVWANQVLNGLLDVAYHHLIMAIPWQLRIVIMLNRKAGLNLITQAATEAVQQWARDIKKMRMGILIVIHTFGADMKWHPHIHTFPQTVSAFCFNDQQVVESNLVRLYWGLAA